MFGYNRRDIIGQNIDIIVPEPLATVHHLYMLHYLSTGREVSFFVRNHLETLTVSEPHLII